MPNMYTWLSARESMDIARCQFCDIKFSHRITEALDSFDYEIHNSVQITFHLAHKWSKWFVSKFSEIMLYTWYFCNLHMIKRKRDNGISIADKAEILIPLSCSKTNALSVSYFPSKSPCSQAALTAELPSPKDRVTVSRNIFHQRIH